MKQASLYLDVIQSSVSDGGGKPPLLLVHGAWHAAWCWTENFLPFFEQAGYPVTAFSLRGHGKSAGHDRLRWWRISDYVQDVVSVMATLTQPPVLVGHSMGGMIVQKVLERSLARAGILLASVPPRGVLATTLRIARRHPRAFVRANATLSLWPLVATPALAQDAFFSRHMSPDKVTHYHAQMQDESYRAFLDMMLFALPRPEQITVPMRVLGAADDRIFLPSEIEATARAYRTTATLFPNMAHDMMLEAGWRSVADAILAWVSGLPAIA